MIATVKPKRIALYPNPLGKTMAAVKKETGCTHILNAASFDDLSTPNCQLKIDGRVYVDDGYKYWAYAWDTAADFSLAVVPCSKANYVALICMLRDGQDEPMIIKPAYAGCRQRTAIGRRADGMFVLYCTLSGRYPEQVRDEMRAAGCVDALLLDSGLSSQCDFDGWILNGGRKVQSFLCIWADAEGEEKVLKKGSKGTEVKALQKQLVKLGFDLGKTGPDKDGCDGDFGDKTDAAVKRFRRDMGLTSNGIVDASTQAALDMACTWEKSGNALVLKAGRYLGVSEPEGDNTFIDKFAELSGTHYGYSAPWCQIFVVDCMAEVGYDPYITASCTAAYTHYQATGAAVALPAVGLLMYLDWDRSGDCDHVGIVAAVGGGYVYVIEGNSGGDGADAVRMKRYIATDARIRGYADPAKDAQAPAVWYTVRLPKAGAERLAREYGGEIIMCT